MAGGQGGPGGSIVQHREGSAPGFVEQHEPNAFDYAGLLRPLRGLYARVVVLALFCGALGAIVGWRVVHPKYKCEGLIRIAYVLPSVMHQTDQNGPIEMFDAFLHAEAVGMQSWRLINLALSDPAWQVTGKGNSPEDVHQFATGLAVDHPNSTDTLHVTFTGDDPIGAAAAVKSIINVFAADYTKRQAHIQQQRLETLVERQDDLQHQADDLEAQSRAISKEFGGVDLERTYDAEDEQLLDLSRQLAAVRLALAIVQEQPQQQAQVQGTQAQGTTVNVPQTAQHAADLSVDQIAMTDPIMQGYLADQERLQDHLADLDASGLERKNPEVVMTVDKIRRAQERVANYANQYRLLHAATATLTSVNPTVIPGTTVASNAQTVDTLRQNEAALSQAYEKIKAELPNLFEKRRQLEDIASNMQNVHRELTEVTERRDSLQVESAAGDRLEIVSTGEVPVAPMTDHRLYAAAAGGVAGAVIPAALIIGFGTIRRRFRYADEAAADLSVREAGFDMLGVLPAMRDDVDDPEQAADTAQCIHQLRARMQITQNTDRGNVYLVTSASPGDGKTSVAMSLAMSYAASGARTLLIDCDLVGQRLTHGLHAEGNPGLREALTTGRLSLQKFASNLSILTTGNAEAHDACTIAPAFIRRLTRACRSHFDAIFFDCGPILGSVEASVVAPEVDGVVFIVSRGQKPGRPNVL